jgi:hypothetical protein
VNKFFEKNKINNMIKYEKNGRDLTNKALVSVIEVRVDGV